MRLTRSSFGGLIYNFAKKLSESFSDIEHLTKQIAI
jgi:hypothetical protein